MLIFYEQDQNDVTLLQALGKNNIALLILCL